MSKATKTFKIGEYCKGGVITVEINGKFIHIIAKDWDMSKGTSKGSNQKNAKEFDRLTIELDAMRDINREMFMFLTDLTTAYYADQVMDFIKSKVNFDKRLTRY